MSYLEELRARRGDPDDPTNQDQARKEYKRAAGRKDRELNQAARHGYESRRDEERQRAEHDKATKPSAKKPAAKKPAAKKPPARRRRPRSASTAARQLAAPVRQQITSGLRTVGLTLAVVALYLVLTTEEESHAFSGVIKGVAGGLRWLTDPTAPIPPKKS